MKIAIIVGSTRPGRKGTAVGQWVLEQAEQRDDVPGKVQFDLLELESFDLPLLEESTVPAAADRDYDTPETRAWSEAIDGYDGFVFVTPEYNHGVPAALKNAVDVLGPEWANKAIAFVGYGADGGVRAVEHWRTIVVNLMMTDVRAQLALVEFDDWDEGTFTPEDRRKEELETLLDQLIEMTESVRAIRLESSA
jgi:NAD(P)H-dependent FMN reductase